MPSTGRGFAPFAFCPGNGFGVARLVRIEDAFGGSPGETEESLLFLPVLLRSCDKDASPLPFFVVPGLPFDAFDALEGPLAVPTVFFLTVPPVRTLGTPRFFVSSAKASEGVPRAACLGSPARRGAFREGALPGDSRFLEAAMHAIFRNLAREGQRARDVRRVWSPVKSPKLNPVRTRVQTFPSAQTPKVPSLLLKSTSLKRCCCGMYQNCRNV